MMNAGEVSIHERLWMSMMEYSVLKEKMKETECGWSHATHTAATRSPPQRHITLDLL
jgi:hypothetical protein